MWRFASELAPLAGSLGGREARAALAACYGALAALLPDLALTAELLTGMNAMSATEVAYTNLPPNNCVFQFSEPWLAPPAVHEYKELH